MLIVLILLLKSILCFSLVVSYLCCYGLVSILKLTLRSYRIRSSRPKLFCKKIVLRNLSKFTGKHLCQSLFFNQVAGLRLEACNFIKKENVCVSRPPALVLASNLYLPALAPTLCLPALVPNFYLPTLAPTLCLPQICIYRLSPGPECAYTDPVSPVCIYWPRPTICTHTGC